MANTYDLSVDPELMTAIMVLQAEHLDSEGQLSAVYGQEGVKSLKDFLDFYCIRMTPDEARQIVSEKKAS